MNKKVLVIAVAVLAVAVLATPLLGTAEACRCRRRIDKIPVTATFVSIGYTLPLKTWTVCDKYEMNYGGTFQFSGTLNLPEETLSGTFNSSRVLSIKNLETDVMKVFYNKVVWTFPAEGGTFEGRMVFEIRHHSEGPLAWEYTILSCVLRGTGAFKGQILVLSYDGPYIGAVLTGLLYKW